MIAAEAYALWAETWDEDAGALVALESVWMSPWLENIAEARVVDAGCGTGRWLLELRARGAVALGFDFSPEMLAKAAAKRLPVAAADLRNLPLPSRCADIVLCALSIGHVPDAGVAMQELARLVKPGGSLLLSDFHPDAYRRGWRRTFRQAGRIHEVHHYSHSVADLLGAATANGLVLEELIEPGFDQRQAEFFRRAGKQKLFDEVQGLPALLLARWRRR
jgi:malonyl-CoA O-methyltransferase